GGGKHNNPHRSAGCENDSDYLLGTMSTPDRPKKRVDSKTTPVRFGGVGGSITGIVPQGDGRDAWLQVQIGVHLKWYNHLQRVHNDLVRGPFQRMVQADREVLNQFSSANSLIRPPVQSVLIEALQTSNVSVLGQSRDRFQGSRCVQGEDSAAVVAVKHDKGTDWTCFTYCGKMRTMEDIYRARSKIANHSFPEGLPLGPWGTHREGMAAINNFTMDPTVGGGAFAVKGLSAPSPTSKVGPLKVLGCDRSGICSVSSNSRASNKAYSKRTACSWRLVMELVDVGWVVRNMAEAACVESDSGKSLCCGHNHKLAVSLAERNSNAALRHIPEWLMSNAKLLQEAGNSYSEIYRFLAEKSREANKEVTFTYGDIKSALSDKQKTKALDTTQLFQYLTDRQNADSNLLGFELYQDDAQKLNRVFFVLKGGRELWCSMGASLVLFDTKHGTNAYGFKLGLFVTVDENGITRIVAGSFVKQEDVASFEWVFIQWNKFMHHSPAIIFTDSDKAMARGIKSVGNKKQTFSLYLSLVEEFSPAYQTSL
ncbi:MAG: hypothetical protein ACREOZ_00900, partial [Gloeomargaritales cyanobacterium]